MNVTECVNRRVVSRFGRYPKLKTLMHQIYKVIQRASVLQNFIEINCRSHLAKYVLFVEMSLSDRW